jgi:hypothetical protein
MSNNSTKINKAKNSQVLGHTQKDSEVKPIHGIPLPYDNWISNDNAKPLTCRKSLTSLIT